MSTTYHKSDCFIHFCKVVRSLLKLPESGYITIGCDVLSFCFKSLKENITLTGHDGFVCDIIELKNSPECNSVQIASCSDDKTMKIWDLNGKCLKTFISRRIIRYRNIELKNGQLATCSNDNPIEILDLDGKCCQTLIGHTSCVEKVIELKNTIGCDSIRLASCSYDNTIKIWDLNGKCLQTLIGHTNCVNNIIELKNSPECDGIQIASCSDDTTIKIWNLNGKCLKTLKLMKPVSDIVELKNEYGNTRLVFCCYDETINIWDLNNKCYTTLISHIRPVKCVIVLKNGQLASCSADETIKIWNIDNKRFNNFENYKCFSTGLIESTDEQNVLQASYKIMKLRNLNIEHRQTLTGHTDHVLKIIELKNGQLVSCSNDKTIKIWG